MVRFSHMLAQKRLIHEYIAEQHFLADKIYVIDTKFGHSTDFFKKNTIAKVYPFGFDVNGLLSTDYLKKTNQTSNSVVYLDYCQTPKASFVKDDMELCEAPIVYMTFSIRNCKCWRSKTREVCKETPYKRAWVYQYCDTVPMLLVCYAKKKAPKPPVNPVGNTYMYTDLTGRYHTRVCKKVLLSPDDDSGLYLKFKDSNEPISNCILK